MRLKLDGAAFQPAIAQFAGTGWMASCREPVLEMPDETGTKVPALAFLRPCPLGAPRTRLGDGFRKDGGQVLRML